VPCEGVAIATPVDLGRQVAIRQPTCRVRYDVQEVGELTLQDAMTSFLEKARRHA
jgi:predicted GTPase